VTNFVSDNWVSYLITCTEQRSAAAAWMLLLLQLLLAK
jgi:hypothetical protein